MPALHNPTIRDRRRVPLPEIAAIVAARLGPGRVPGNAQPAAFSRHVAMYMASQVGWSTTQIGKFYNGRDHSTVCYAVARITARRRTDASVDRLVTVLEGEIKEREQAKDTFKSLPKVADDPQAICSLLPEVFLETLAARIASRVLLELTGLHAPTTARNGGETKMAEGSFEGARGAEGPMAESPIP